MSDATPKSSNPRIVLAGVLLAMALPGLFSPVLAGQEAKVWEFHLAFVHGSKDGAPLEATAHATDDWFGTGPSSGTLTQEVKFENSNFMAFRLGYLWSSYIESEVSYDRDHSSTNYSLKAVEDSTGATIAKAQDDIGAVTTTYQIAMLYHPLASYLTPWQPFVLAGAGWIDTDLEASEAIRDVTNSSDVANAFHYDFPRDDNGIVIVYGAGVKFLFKESFAARAEWRTKRFELFDESRTDREISIGISFYGIDYM